MIGLQSAFRGYHGECFQWAAEYLEARVIEWFLRSHQNKLHVFLNTNRITKPFGFIVHRMRYRVHCSICSCSQIAEDENPFNGNEEWYEAVDGKDRECLNVLLTRKKRNIRFISPTILQNISIKIPVHFATTRERKITYSLAVVWKLLHWKFHP